MSAVLVVLAAGAGTYLLRVGVLLVLGDREAPAWLRQVSTFVAPAAFAALATSGLASRVGDGQGAGVVAAVAVAAVSVRLTRSANAALVTGLPTMWLVTSVLG